MKSFRTALFFVSAALAACAACAYNSVYVPGTVFGRGNWATDDAGQRLYETANGSHVWTNRLVAATESGEFRFLANGSWDVNWSASLSITALPATDCGPLSQGGGNIGVTNLVAGTSYFVSFNDTTAMFSIFDATAAAETPTSVKLIGEFNSHGDDDIGVLSPNGDGTWSVS